MTVGIIAEYNPLHSGHLFHITETKKRLPGAKVVCVISGNFVQRGDIAIADKNARARAAVLAGADLVFELPTPYALAPAPLFARGAVFLLNATGVLTHISFGCECGDVRPLIEAAAETSSPEFRENIRVALTEGRSYAAACGASFSDGLAEICASPNNLLGIEYIRAVNQINPKIVPVAIRRTGGGHDDLSETKFPSASLIRSRILSGVKPPDGALPDFMDAVTVSERQAGRFPADIRALDQAMTAVLKRMSVEELKEVPEITEGLENAVFNAAKTAGSVPAMLDALKSKRYTHSRLRRVLLSAFLGLTREFQQADPPYLRLLAAGENGRELLREIAEKAAVPVVTKPARLKELPGCAKLAEFEARADALYSLAYPDPKARGDGGFFTRSPFVIR